MHVFVSLVDLREKTVNYFEDMSSILEFVITHASVNVEFFLINSSFVLNLIVLRYTLQKLFIESAVILTKDPCFVREKYILRILVAHRKLVFHC